MIAIIPVAGVGTRLRPHTHTAPKVLLHVAGKPILGHILDELLELGVTETVFIVGHLGQMVEQYVATSYPMLNARFVEQEERKGLGHAIWLTRPVADGRGPLLIILGDTIFQADLRGALNNHESVIGVKEVADPRRFGVVEMDADGHVSGLVEKPEHPKTNLAIVGIYLIREPDVLFDCLDQLIREDRRTSGEYQLTDALALMLRRGVRMKTFTVNGWLDCGKPETMLETNRLLLEEKERQTPVMPEYFPESIVLAPVSISPGAKIERSIIGPYVSVSDGARVRNSIVSNSIISENAEVSNIILDSSIISNNARLKGHRSRLNVGDSSEISFE